MTKRLTFALISFGLLIGFALRPQRAFDTASAAAGEREERSGSIPGLQAQPAVDLLKKHGLYESVKAAIDADRHEIRPALDESPNDSGAVWATSNPEQNLRARFSRQGVRLTPGESCAGEEWQAVLELRGIGYGGRINRLVAGPMLSNGNRIETQRVALADADHGRRSLITEWYVNRAEGIEQGFTVAERPDGFDSGFNPDPLRLEMSLKGGLKATLEDGAQAITLGFPEGREALRYDHLLAWDALGRALPARMEVNAGTKAEGESITLLVDDAGAVYPVTIDPLFTQVRKVEASDGEEQDKYGIAVSISGDTAVVGASGDDDNTGAAYIIERNRGSMGPAADNWGEVKKLLASDGEESDRFGAAVGISGGTVIVAAGGNDSNRGAAYIFERNKDGADNWGEVKKLVASDRGLGHSFGSGVAISLDTVVVGASGNGGGAAYVFERNTGGADAWGQVKKLTAMDETGNEKFGISTAISGDTALIGAELDEGKGAAYIFERNTGGADNWGEVKKLVASDGESSDRFGRTVGLSVDTAIVGAFGENGNRGAAYIYERNKDVMGAAAENWGEVKKLVAADGEADDWFGFSVGISNDTAIVGARQDSGGSAYIFTRNRGGLDNWGRLNKLTPGDGTGFDDFSDSVAISGDTVLVGASGFNFGVGAGYVFTVGCDPVEKHKRNGPGAGSNSRFATSVAISGDTAVVGADGFQEGTQIEQGAAFVFVRNQGGRDNWGFLKKLLASDGALGDKFGFSVGISGETIIVGARAENSTIGAAYIFERNKNGADNWGEVRKLQSSDGMMGDSFGAAVGISGETAIVGANGDDSNRGSAYIFARNRGGADNWGQVKKLVAPSPAPEDLFGWTVGISGETAIVGAPGENLDQGGAYIFARNQGGDDNWGQVRRLTASDGEADDDFGISVAISLNTAIVGARAADGLTGAAYIYERNKGAMGPVAENWGEVKKLAASDGVVDDRFGVSVSIDFDTALVGALGDEGSRGAAYVFERNKATMGSAADNWGEVTKLTASDGGGVDLFGAAVSISGKAIIVGAFGDNSSSGSSYIYDCEPEPDNDPPTIMASNTTRTAGAGIATSTIAVVGDAEDAEETLNVTVLLQSGSGVTITGIVVDASGNVTASVEAACTATTSTFELKVEDSGDETATATLTVNVDPNPLPTLSYNNQSILVGQTPSFSPASGPSDNVSVTSIALQSVTPMVGLGVTVNNSTGLVTVTGSIQPGIYTVVVVAIDSCNAERTASFTVNVGCPTLTLSSLSNGQVGAAYNRTVNVSPAGGYTLELTGGNLPPGLTLNEMTGAITGAPTMMGSFSFTLTATSGSGCTGVRSYTVVISCPSIALAPTTLGNGQAGVFYTRTISVTPASMSYTFGVISGSLPAGLTLDGTTGVLSGTPQTLGSFSFTLRATAASGCTATRSYTVVISCPSISITPTTLQAGTVGAAYNETLTASPAAGVYTFAVNFGSLPPGVTLNAMTGQLSGVPMLKGNYYLTIRAGAFGTCGGTRTYVLVIH